MISLNKMQAVLVNRVEGRPTMTLGLVPVPSPGVGEVKIRVLVAGVNRADLMIRDGILSRSDQIGTLGYECAGVVLEVAEGEPRWKVGDRVCGMTLTATYAEVAIGRSDQLFPVPSGLTPAQAAALPLAACTTWAHLFDSAQLSRGQWVLLHGGASGVGTLAVQMAHRLGLHVIATAGSDEKAALCVSLGAVRGVNYRTHEFENVVVEATSGRGVDVVLDVVGAPYLNRNLSALCQGGRLLIMGYQGGWQGELDLRILLDRLASVSSVSFSKSAVERRASIVATVEKSIWPLIASRAIVPVLGGLFPLEAVTECHGLLETGTSAGKLLLSPVPYSDGGPAWDAAAAK